MTTAAPGRKQSVASDFPDWLLSVKADAQIELITKFAL